jgi:hypothetical protein
MRDRKAHDEWLRKELAIGLEECARGESLELDEAYRQLAEERPDIFGNEMPPCREDWEKLNAEIIEDEQREAEFPGLADDGDSQ